MPWQLDFGRYLALLSSMESLVRILWVLATSSERGFLVRLFCWQKVLDGTETLWDEGTWHLNLRYECNTIGRSSSEASSLLYLLNHYTVWPKQTNQTITRTYKGKDITTTHNPQGSPTNSPMWKGKSRDYLGKETPTRERQELPWWNDRAKTWDLKKCPLEKHLNDPCCADIKPQLHQEPWSPTHSSNHMPWYFDKA